MKSILLILATIGLAFNLAASDTLHVATTIDEVKVYYLGAEVQRTGEVGLNKGQQYISLNGLPFPLDAKSIQVKLKPEVKLLTIQLEKKEPSYAKSPAEKKLETKIRTEQDSIRKIQDEILIQQEMERMIYENRQFSNKEGVSQVSEVKLAIQYYEEKLESIKKKIQHYQFAIRKHNKTIEDLEKEISQLQQTQDPFSSSIVLQVECLQKGSYPIQVSYRTDMAGWKPDYELRANNINDPIKLTFRAKIFQNSGENWHEVPITLLSGIPRESSEKPRMNIWYVNQPQPVPVKTDWSKPGRISGRVFDSNQLEPIPFANVLLLKNNEVVYAVNTDMDGNFLLFPVQEGYYQLQVKNIGYQNYNFPNLYLAKGQQFVQNIQLQPAQQQLAEVTVIQAERHYKMPLASGDMMAERENQRLRDEVISFDFIENQTNQSLTQLSFSIREKVSIPGNGKENHLRIKEYQIPVTYRHEAVPQYDSDVFLTAGIANFAALNLLPGEGLVFFEDNYVGETYLHFDEAADTLQVSLGRDRLVQVERKSKKELGGKRIIGKTVKDELAYELVINNKRTEAIQLSLEEQIPVSQQEVIEIQLTESSGAQHDQKKGFLKWDLTIPANQTKTIQYQYEMKYPETVQIRFR